MRVFFSLLILFNGLLCAEAASPRVDRLDRVQAGIFSLGEVKTIKDANISAGQRTEAPKAKLVQVGRNIPAKINTAFGIHFQVLGSPKGAKIPVKVIWRYPQPGLKNPATGTTKFSDEYIETLIAGNSADLYWNLASAWTLVPGKWTIELWQGSRQLLAQEFILSKP